MAHFITGVITEILTPYNKDGTINFNQLRELIKWQMDCGIKNFFINGLAGECQAMTNEEKLEVTKVVYSVTQGNAKIMNCAFEASINLNLELLKSYMKQGLSDCYCITPPPYFKHSQEAVEEYLGELIDICDKPVYIYNCKEMSVLCAPDTLKNLVTKHPNLRGYKDASTDILNFIQCTMRIDSEVFDFLGGCDGLDGVMMLLGAVGCVSFMAVPFPKEMIDIVEAGLRGDKKACINAQYKVLRIRNLLKQTPFNAGWIYAMRYGGGPSGMYSRMPIQQDYVSEEIKEKLDNLAIELGYDPQKWALDMKKEWKGAIPQNFR